MADALDARKLAWWFCLAVGVSLLLNWILGLVFGGREFATSDDPPRSEFNFFFEFNGWHHLLHVLTAAVLVAAIFRRDWAPACALLFGAVYLVLTPLAVADGNDVANAVYSDTPDNFVHGSLAVAGVALGVAGFRAAYAASASASPAARSPDSIAPSR